MNYCLLLQSNDKIYITVMGNLHKNKHTCIPIMEKNKKKQSNPLKKKQLKVVEWIPWTDDPTAWTQEISPYCQSLFKYTKALPNIEIHITEQMIADSVNKFEKDNDVEKNDEEYTVYKIYKIYCDDEKIVPIISYTKTTIEHIVTEDLRRTHQKGTQRLTSFKNNLTNTRYKLLACYKAKGHSVKALNVIKNSYNTCDKSHEALNDPIYTVYNTIVKNTIDAIPDEYKGKLVKKLYYIYKIHDLKNTDDIYIFGSFDIVKKSGIKKICDTKCLTFRSTSLVISTLAEHECYFELEGQIKTDEYVYLNKSLDVGINKYYFFIQNKVLTYTQYDIANARKEVFCEIQRELMLLFFEFDANDYENNGYIACIEHDQSKIIIDGYKMSVKDRLNELYLKNTSVINENSLFCLKIYLLEKNIDEKLLPMKMLYYKKRFISEVVNSDIKKNNFSWKAYHLKKKQAVAKE